MYKQGDIVRVRIKHPLGGLTIKVGVIHSSYHGLSKTWWVHYDKAMHLKGEENLELMSAKDIARWKERTGQAEATTAPW